jgi:hypothetical protein
MKKAILTSFLLICISVISGFAQGKKAEGKAEAGNNTYFVQSPHTEQECLAALDDAKEKGLLGKVQFGCMSGDHTGYAFLHGKDEASVRQKLPQSIREKAKIQKVDKFTPEQVAGFHKHN